MMTVRDEVSTHEPLRLAALTKRESTLGRIPHPSRVGREVPSQGCFGAWVPAPTVAA